MKKTTLLLLLALVTNLALAQRSQSFAEYWFGIKPEANLPKLEKTQTSARRAPLKTNPKGLRQSGIITLDLGAPLNPKSFEVNEKGYWVETYNDEEYTFFETNAPFAFSHLIEGVGASWGGMAWNGFTYSKNGDNRNHGNGGSQGWVANQWGNMAGGGIKTDDQGNVMTDENGTILTDPDSPYLIAFWSYTMEPEYWHLYYGSNLTEPTHNLQTLFTDGNRYEAVGLYVNNHPWPYYGNESGDGFARPFQEGDYFKLHIHALDHEGKETGKKVVHILAEYKEGVLRQSANWEWVDLSSLGEIGGLYYTLETTDADPVWGPNTAAYFCIDKLQIQAIEEQPEVTITLNGVTQLMQFKNKATGEMIEIGTPTNYTYTFNTPPGDYILYGYRPNGTTLNGTIELTITEESNQNFQICTLHTAANTGSWTPDVDYTITPTVMSSDGINRNATLGIGSLGSWRAILALEGDHYTLVVTPSETHQLQGYNKTTFTGIITALTASHWTTLEQDVRYSVTLPAEATLYVGIANYQGYYYRPFTEVKSYEEHLDGETKTLSYYISKNKVGIYRISQPGKITYANLFTKSDADETLTITPEMLQDDEKTIDYNVTSNKGYNVADIYLNINERGHLNLTAGKTHQIVNLRNWQTVNNTTANLFIEPDYHYTVINEKGQEETNVVTVDDKGLLTAIGKGSAIVLVTYDAINLPSAAGGPLFGALWPENTGVFVVTVDGTSNEITPNMTINETLNQKSDKNAGINVDAELDVFYYLEEEGAYHYTFNPQGVNTVELAQPIVGTHSTTYRGFTTQGVTAHEDGSYTVALIHGRNIVKLTSATGVSYQVLTAKPVTYTLTNKTNPDETIKPGDEVAIKFTTLYHPANKLAGVYNMTAYIVYTANQETLVNTGNQYAFASSTNGQTIHLTIPQTWDINEKFVLTNGVLRAGGTSGLNYGDPFGNHRLITLTGGSNPNFSASQRMAHFGALPNITIPLYSATGIELSQESATLTLNETLQLTATLQPEENPEVNFRWHSADEAIATVTQEGVVTAVSLGSTTITVTTADGNLSATCHIEVNLTSDISGTTENSTVRAYPNPFIDYLVIESNTEQSACLYHETGRIIQQIRLQNGSARINTNNLTKGLYLLRIGNQTHRLIK